MAAIESLQSLDPEARRRFDLIIDVRSPSEFAEDHVPGAVNLPVLSDAERAEVGTIYVQASKFDARRIGASYVARNVADHIAGPLADKGGGFHPLLYCWRGGMRSNAMAVVLAEVGWRVAVLKGGYKTYRNRVRERLYDQTLDLQVVLLDGPTGSAKTEILRRAAALGVQTIDLEGLAAHRGSLLGALPGRPQPGQKLFESRLLAGVEALDPSRPVLIEAESSKVGERMVPPALWGLMTDAPRIRIAAPPPARVAYLMSAYADTTADREGLDAALARLPLRLGRKRVETWRALARAGAFEELAEELLSRHYDPSYARSSRAEERTPMETLELDRLDHAALDTAALAISERLARLAAATRATQNGA